MKERNNETVPEESMDYSSVSEIEDAALKTMMQFFADELLPYFGIPGKVVGIAPTETVRLEIRKSFNDFNLVMEDGSWKHFEFQSSNKGLAGLKRFRFYEANMSYQHNVKITTYVLFSENIQRPMTEFTEGVNTYRVVPIIMRHRDDGIQAGIQMGVQEGVQKGLQTGIEAMILDNVEANVSKERIIEKLQRHFRLSSSEAENYYLQYSQSV